MTRPAQSTVTLDDEMITVRLTVQASGYQDVQMTRAQFAELTERLDDEMEIDADEARADWDAITNDLEYTVDGAEERKVAPPAPKKERRRR